MGLSSKDRAVLEVQKKTLLKTRHTLRRKLNKAKARNAGKANGFKARKRAERVPAARWGPVVHELRKNLEKTESCLQTCVLKLSEGGGS